MSKSQVKSRYFYGLRQALVREKVDHVQHLREAFLWESMG